MSSSNSVPQCKAQRTSGGQCKNKAKVAVIGPELDCCDVQQHIEQLERMKPAQPEGRTEQLHDSADPVIVFEEHAGPESEPAANVPPPPAPDLAALDKLAGDTFGTLPPEDPDAADAAAMAPAAAPAAQLGGEWTADRVRVYLVILSARVEADGKEPLTPAEIREGSQLLAPVAQQFLGNMGAKSPTLALLVWTAATLGPRYAGELRAFAVAFVRRIVALARGRRGAVAETRAPNVAGEDVESAGWGAR